MGARQLQLGTFVRSTVGMKISMGVSGAVLAGFVLFHMLGNLQIFRGQEAYNAYAEFMYGMGPILWIARLGLLAMLALHVWAGVTLNRRNRAARPNRYARLRQLATSPYALYMMLSGLVVLAFLAYHLAHFTLGFVHTTYFDAVDALGRRDVYTNFIKSFQDPFIVTLYVVANLLLAVHLAHGVSSMFRTLGLSAGTYRLAFDKVGPGLALVVAAGNLSMPLAILLGMVTT